PAADGPKDGAAKRDDPGAKGYGSISGRVVLVGEIPVLPVLVRAGDNRLKSEDRATCAREDIPDECLLVEEKTRGIANVFVYLPEATRGIHPKLEMSEEREVVCDIKGCRYTPRAVFARTDQVVVVHILDNIVHNVHMNPIRRSYTEPIRPLSERQEFRFE